MPSATPTDHLEIPINPGVPARDRSRDFGPRGSAAVGPSSLVRIVARDADPSVFLGILAVPHPERPKLSIYYGKATTREFLRMRFKRSSGIRTCGRPTSTSGTGEESRETWWSGFVLAAEASDRRI